MRVNFTVRGNTAAELREEADRILGVLDPEARWKINITASPIAETIGAEVQLWEGEVDAYDLTGGQY